MSDEDDYMSDAFLQSLDDKRPGLIHGKKAQRLIKEERIRQIDADHREQQRLKSRKRLAEQMIDAREEALATSLTEAEPENKGLKLMMKMGFKVGSGLGKLGEGRKVPVPVNDVKVDKKGVGVKMKEREREKMLVEMALKRRKMSAQNEKSLTRNYKQNARIKAYQARNYKFVAQSQKALYDLDSNNDVTEPDNPHHWPKFTRKPKEVEKTEDETSDINQKLALMADPLNSSSILEKRVLGNDQIENVDKEEEEEEVDNEELLVELTIILRTRYFYCVFCGCKYENEKDLNDNCPGDEYEDHE